MAEVDREGTGTIEFPEFLSISQSSPFALRPSRKAKHSALRLSQ